VGNKAGKKKGPKPYPQSHRDLQKVNLPQTSNQPPSDNLKVLWWQVAHPSIFIKYKKLYQ